MHPVPYQLHHEPIVVEQYLSRRHLDSHLAVLKPVEIGVILERNWALFAGHPKFRLVLDGVLGENLMRSWLHHAFKLPLGAK
jgi:hypothetical protein